MADDLAAFLRELKLEKYLPALRQNDVTDLEGLEQDVLGDDYIIAEIGLSKGAVKKIQRHLKSRSSSSTPVAMPSKNPNPLYQMAMYDDQGPAESAHWAAGNVAGDIEMASSGKTQASARCCRCLSRQLRAHTLGSLCAADSARALSRIFKKRPSAQAARAGAARRPAVRRRRWCPLWTPRGLR